LKRRLILALALTVPLLAGCGPSDNATPVSSLPYPPSDIQTCFRGAANIPDRALTMAEVETLWKQDRIRSVVEAKCGKRLLAWYGQLQADWK
jgi:hypothetical protein